MVIQTNAQLCYTLTRFMSVAVHTLLHHRQCYPSRSFVLARAYDHPVRQSRHPVLCRWIEDAIDAVHAQLLGGTLARAALVICDARTGAPLERFVFDFGQLPQISAEDANTLFVREGQTVDLDDEDEEEADLVGPEELDLSESLRAVLSKLSSLGGRLDPIPPACTFTVAVELKGESDIEALNGKEDLGDDNEALLHEEPIAPSEKEEVSDKGLEESEFKPDDTTRTQPWVLGRPGRFRRSPKEDVRIVPIRSVDAGELVFEMWAEERPVAKRAAREAPPIIRPPGMKDKADADKGKAAHDAKSTGNTTEASVKSKTQADETKVRSGEQKAKQKTEQKTEKIGEQSTMQTADKMTKPTSEQIRVQTTSAGRSSSVVTKRVRFAEADDD